MKYDFAIFDFRKVGSLVSIGCRRNPTFCGT